MNPEDVNHIPDWIRGRHRAWLSARWLLLVGSFVAPSLLCWAIRDLNLHTNFIERGLGDGAGFAILLVALGLPLGVVVASAVTLVYTVANWKGGKLAVIMARQSLPAEPRREPDRTA